MQAKLLFTMLKIVVFIDIVQTICLNIYLVELEKEKVHGNIENIIDIYVSSLIT